MQEDAAVRLEPGRDAGEQFAPVRHVLEHFDGDDAVEARIVARSEVVHVGGDDVEVRQSAPGCLVEDVGALRGRIRNRGDGRARELFRHPQRQGAPAAAEFQDPVAVTDVRVRDGDLEGAVLGVVEAGIGVLEVAAGILVAVAEDLLEEGGRDLVVLLVGLAGGECDGKVRHGAGEVAGRAFWRAREGAAGAVDEVVNAGPGEGVGQRGAFGQRDQVFDNRQEVILRSSGAARRSWRTGQWAARERRR